MAVLKVARPHAWCRHWRIELKRDQQMFIKNTWYVACMPEDINGKPLGRKICGLPMVFFRNEAGQPAALEDFCPHRGAPLSLGQCKDGKLMCGYHGLEMGCEGKTIAMPGQRVGGFPAIKVYPAVEHGGFVWVWPGDAPPDLAKLPEMVWHNNPEWAYGGGLYHVQAGYELMIDNLMDLTHETYVHSTSIGQPEIDETPCKTRVDGDRVYTERYMSGIEAPPFWKMAMRAQGLDDSAKVDRWQVCQFAPPSHIMIEVGVALEGEGGIHAPDDKKAYSVVVDFITPESDTSMWYFWGMARKFKPDDAELTASIRAGQGGIFAEDTEMLERQQQNLLMYPDRKLLMLNIDGGGVQSRRVIARHLALEAV
jgi:vanillate monooxygenase